MTDLLVSDHNLQRLDTKQLLRHIRASIEAGSNIAYFGRRGCGKSQIAEQAVMASKHRLVYMPLSLFERPDLMGYPDLANSPDKFVHYLLPLIFQPLLEGNEPCVLFLDEIDKADHSLDAALLDLLEKHSINGTKLPNLVSVISAGNLISEGGQKPIPPLLDRTEKYLAEATVEAWLEWAGAHIHPSVCAFIHDKPNRLVGAIDHPTHLADESPRSWHKTSNVCHFGEKFNWEVDLIAEKASGFVGKEAGIDFALYFFRYKKLLPIIDKVFAELDYKAEFNDLAPNEQLYVAMIAASRLAAYLDINKIDRAKEPDKRSTEAKAMLRASGEFFNRVYDTHPEFVLIVVRNQLRGRWTAWDLAEASEWNGLLPKLNAMSKGR